MKRQEFLKELTAAGCYLKRHGSNDDIYVIKRMVEKIPFPAVRKSKTVFVSW